jgi:diaminopimelate decarboxylase
LVQTLTQTSDLLPVTTSRGPAGQLQIAGHDLDGLAKSWGTPLYLFDAATVRQQVHSLQQHLRQYPSEAGITYAAKAYFSLGIARRLAQLGIGVDVVSRGELEVARQAGFQPEDVHLHGNNKTEEEIELALQWGIHCIVVDSLDELGFVEQISARLNLPANIWLRITPGLDIDTHPYLQTGSKATKFGLPISDGQAAQAIRAAQNSKWLNLTGLHMHLGSQIRQSQPYAEAITMLVALAEKENYIPAEISPGGGLGVVYRSEDVHADEGQWVNTITSTVQKEFHQRGWPLPRLILEPGRWLVARAGIAVYAVGTTKHASDGTYFVSVDGGMADNPRPALYQAAYTALSVNRPDAEANVKTTIAGKFCESGDELISGIMLPELQRGDLLAIPVAGAYQLSMASNYNLAPRPAVLWLEGARVEVLQEREFPHQAGWFVNEPPIP